MDWIYIFVLFQELSKVARNSSEIEVVALENIFLAIARSELLA